MPEYLSPGVYVEEIEIGAKPIEGVSTSNAGFLGQTDRGPTEVRLVTSFGEFQRLYGGYLGDSYMAYAVESFFRNGGQRCFIGRIVKNGAVKSSLTLAPVKFTAIGEGISGDQIRVYLQNASLDPSTDTTTPQRNDLFKLIIGYWQDASIFQGTPVIRDLISKALTLEIYDNLSTDSNSPSYYVSKVNKVSNLVQLEATAAGRPTNTTEFKPLAAGSDGTELRSNEFIGDTSVAPDQRRGLAAFEQVDEINIVYVPDLHFLDDTNQAQLTDAIVSHCENLKDRFAILDIAQGESNITALRPPKDSKYAAVYYPWLRSFDPLTNGQKLFPPGGAAAGIYARSDQERGVHKAPANEVVRGALDLEFKITKGEQDLLNPRGVNVIRSFPGRGIRVWGARTTSSDPLWKYINVRRLFLFLEESIDEGTQWVVFEPNNEKLWARVIQTITQFLTTVWRTGALMGLTQEEAFFVRCDRTTMTQDDIDNGRLICVIGVAPTKPAEFVIFRIAQFTGSSELAEI